jgi:hypothetical protein
MTKRTGVPGKPSQRIVSVTSSRRIDGPASCIRLRKLQHAALIATSSRLARHSMTSAMR